MTIDEGMKKHIPLMAIEIEAAQLKKDFEAIIVGTRKAIHNGLLMEKLCKKLNVNDEFIHTLFKMFYDNHMIHKDGL